MRAVIYTRALEPITVVDLSMGAWRMLERGDRVRLLPPLELRDLVIPPAGPPTMANFKPVTVYAAKFVYRGARNLMLFTDDEETALALKAAFLPGQYSEVQRREGKARVDGFMKALRSLRDEG